MATLRTPLKRRVHRRITPEAIEALRTGDFLRLHRSLGLRPWEASPLDVSTAEPPAWMLNNKHACDDWRQAYALRLEIEKLSIEICCEAP